MKKHVSLLKTIALLLFVTLALSSKGQVSVNTTGTAAHPSAMLDVSSTNKGLLIPRMTLAERNAISNPTTSLLVYVTNDSTFYFYTNSGWQKLGNGVNGWSETGNYIYTLNDSVGIGTDTPEAPLEIYGRISQKGTGMSVFLGESSGENDDGTNNANVFVGYQAGVQNISGSNNVAVGSKALLDNKKSNNNIAVGIYALSSDTSGSSNVAIGANAQKHLLNGYSNVAIGVSALEYNKSINNTVAIGDSALFYNGVYDATPYPINNVAIGSKTLFNNHSGKNNTAIGYNSLYSNYSGWGNSAIGNNALYSNTNGYYCTAVGNLALSSNTSGIYNTAIGVKSLDSNVTGNYNTALGSYALLSNVSGNYNIAIGYRSTYSNKTGENNIAAGTYALYSLKSGNNNIVFGEGAERNDTTGSNNIAIGRSALYGNAHLNDLIAIGDSALSAVGGSSNYLGKRNIAIGKSALMYNYIGENNLAVGYQALKTNTGGSNTALGANALSLNTQSKNLVAVGDSALFNNSKTGQYWWANNNTGIGSKSMLHNINGGGNTAVGYSSLLNNTDGKNNTVTGTESLKLNVEGDNNIAIGYRAGYSSTGDGNIFLGYQAGYNETGSNKLYIANSNTSTPLIGGDFSTNEVDINGQLKITGGNPGNGKILASDANGIASWVDGTTVNGGGWTLGSSIIYNLSSNVGIGTPNPTEKLEVNGQVKITGGNPGNGKFLASDANGKASWEIPNHVVMYDADSNTLIQTEKTTNDDQIHFTLGGTNYFTMEQGRISVFNTGGSIFLGDNAGAHDDLSDRRNIFIGHYAGYLDVTGDHNIGIGYKSLKYNDAGSNNTAVGSYSLYSNTGQGNTALGSYALKQNENGMQNAAVGYQALTRNNIGFSNSAFGAGSMLYNTSGSSNSSYGAFALVKNTTGSKNTASGAEALTNNTTGNYNIGMGYRAGKNLTKGSNNIIIGYNIDAPVDSADYQLNIGNLIFSNGIDGQDSIVSSGNIGIGVKNPTARLEVNGQVKITGGNPGSGKILSSDADGEASWVDGATVNGGGWNVNASYIYNTSLNVGIGDDHPHARLVVAGKIYQQAVGKSVFLGYEAGLSDDLSDNKNVFVGYEAGKKNTTGYHNSAMGYNALLNDTTGHGNTAAGYEALQDNVTGYYNTAVGKYALSNNTSYFNCTGIGYNAQVTSNNTIRLGDNNITWIGGHSSWHNTSDGRFKKEVSGNVPGLDFILKLHPVTYKWDIKSLNRYTGVEQADETGMPGDDNQVHTGFIAQEVESAAKATNFDFDAVHTPQNSHDTYSLAYAEFVVPLVKGMQEQQKMIEQLQKQNRELMKRLEKLEKKNNNQR